MKIAVVGLENETKHVIEEAKKQHIQIVLVDDKNEEITVAKHIKINPFDSQAVVNALCEESIDLCIAAPGSKYLETVGKVNDTLSLPGISAKTAEYCVDKYSLHNRLRNLKLRPGHCYIVNKDNLFDPLRMAYPCILKPRFGKGCRNVYYLETPEELFEKENLLWGDVDSTKALDADSEDKEDADAFTRRIKRYMESRMSVPHPEKMDDEDYLLEEAFAGNEYGIDAMVEGCNFELILIRKKFVTNPPSRVAVGYMSVVPEEELRLTDIITEYMSKATEVLGLKDCLVHADLIIQGRKCAAVEISAEPARQYIYNEFVPRVTGINMYKEYLAYIEGESHNFAPLQTRKMYLGFFSMEGCFIHNIPNPKTFEFSEKVKLKKWECNMKLLDYQGSITDVRTLLKRGFYILEGPNDRSLLEAVNIINNSFEIK